MLWGCSPWSSAAKTVTLYPDEGDWQRDDQRMPAPRSIEARHIERDQVVVKRTLQTTGFLTVHSIVGRQSATNLHAHVTARLDHDLECDGSQFASVLTPTCRWDHKLALTGPVRAVLAEALDCLHGVISSILGVHAELWELAALSSAPGAPRQQVHPDCSFQDAPPALVVFIALCDVARSMGPTVVLPGTQTASAHERFNGGCVAGTRAKLLSSSQHCAPLLKRGDALVLDARCLHCGGANTSRKRRTLFYFTFVRPDCARLALRRPSLLHSLSDRVLRLDERTGWLASDCAYLESPVRNGHGSNKPPGEGDKVTLARLSKVELLGMAEDDEPGDCLAS